MSGRADGPSGDVRSFLGNLRFAFDSSPRRRALSIAAVRGSDRVLALGFDDELIEAVLKAVPEGFFAGLDHERVVERARKKYRDPLELGRADFAQGDQNAIPFARDFFDCALCIERFERWQPEQSGLREARRVLRPDGLLVVALRVLDKSTLKREGASFNEAVKAPNRDEALLQAVREAGFIKPAVVEERYLTARKPLAFRDD